MSSGSTPAPSGTSLESRNYMHAPRPFKNPSYSKSANRRTRSLKQILAAERDLALGVEQPASKKASGGHQKGAGGGGKRMLTGAAAAAARRREEQLANESGAATPAAETEDGDTTMAISVAGTSGTQTPAVSGAAPVVLDPEAENMLKRRRALPTYASIEAPPSLRPRKKFCDVTGLIAPYTDPKTGLRYHSVEIYEIIKTFGPGVDQTYLSLRGEATQIK